MSHLFPKNPQHGKTTKGPPNSGSEAQTPKNPESTGIPGDGRGNRTPGVSWQPKSTDERRMNDIVKSQLFGLLGF